MKQHVVFPPIKLGGLYLMICDFFFFKTRFTLLQTWRAHSWVHQFHKKKKLGFIPVQHDLRQSNNTPPCSRSRKRKPESLQVILEPLLVWSGPVFLCSHCLLCVQHARWWSVEDTKTQNEVKDDLCLLCAGHNWSSLSILGVTLWGKDPNTHFQFSSVAQTCPILCDPTDCSTPGFPVHH